MTRRSPRSSAEVRKLVVDAATTLFAERGYARVATRDIARYADVTPSQLFAHFGTKARLFEIACVEPYVVAVSGFAERWPERPELSDQLYTTLLNELFDVIGARPGLMTALIIAQAHEESLVDEIAPSLRPVDEALRPLEQLVRTPSDPDAPVLTVRLTHGAVVAATQFQPWLTDHLTDRETTIAAMTDLLRNGVGPLGPPAPSAGPSAPGADPGPGEGMRPRLLDAAAELFRRRGYPGVSTRSIAAAAGTSETILFRHFPTKTLLFEQAVSEPWSRSAAEFLERTADSDLAELIGELYRLFQRHRPALLSLLEFERQGTAATPAPISALTDHVRRRLPADRPHASGIAGVIVAAVLGAAALDVWLFTGRPPGDDLVVAGLVELVHSGFPLR